MAINKIQFQSGLSLNDFIQTYGTETQCEQALLASRWPEGFRCPYCHQEHHSTFYRDGRKYWKCLICGHQTTLLSGTIFQATKLPLTRWFQAMYFLTSTKNNVSALELKRHLGVSYGWSNTS